MKYASLLAFSLLATGATSVSAADRDHGRDGMYALAEAGKSLVSWGHIIATDMSSKDAIGSAWRAGGGYRFNDFLGVEGQYVVLHGARRPGVGSFDATSATLAAVGFLPLGDRFELFGKIQVTRSNNRFHAAKGSPYVTTSDRVTSAASGVGLNIYLSRALAVRAEVDGLTKQSKRAERESGVGSITGRALTVGIAYTF